MSLLAVISLCLAFLGVTALPAKRQTLAQVISKCTKPNTVALTFDDGPYVYMNDIVNALDGAGAKGTFFFNGNNFGCIYNADAVDRVKYAYNRGHQVASHTWAHKDLTTLSFDQIQDEMLRVEQALVRITGASPAFMRPPYGRYNDLVLQVSGAHGQSVAIWDFDSQDSLNATPDTPMGLYDGRVNQHPSNILALNHETIETTAHQVLPYAIQKLQAAGYQLVTLAECLEMPAYQSVVDPGTPDSNWHC